MMSGVYFHQDFLVLILILTFRSAVATLTRTSFVPDEYFQVMEPAAHGHLTWEWQPAYRLRSFVGVLPFALFYEITYRFGVFSPRILQAVVCTISDFAFYKLTRLTNASQTSARISLACNLFSWSMVYCMCRTLANSTEAACYVIGVALAFSNELLGSILVATISTYIRPTAIFLWLPVYWHLIFCAHKVNWVHMLVLAAVVVCCCISIDSIFYGAITVTPVNFVRINVLEKFSSLYGVQSWHWYISQGIPVMLGPFYVAILLGGIVIKGSYQDLSPVLRVLLSSAALYVIMLSLLSAHKEFRFLLPCLPVFHMLVGHIVGQWLSPAPEPAPLLSDNSNSIASCAEVDTGAGSAESSVTRKGDHSRLRRINIAIMIMLVAAWLLQVSVGMYLNIQHQAGGERAMLFVNKVLHSPEFLVKWRIRASKRRVTHLHTTTDSDPDADTTVISTTSQPDLFDDLINIFQLSTCHSFPGYSYLQLPISDAAASVVLRFPDCSPRAILSNSTQSQAFAAAPVTFYETVTQAQPSHSQSVQRQLPYWGSADIIMTYDGHVDDHMNDMLVADGFELVATFHHASFRYDYDDPVLKMKSMVYVHHDIIA